MDSDDCIAAVPIRSVAPPKAECTNEKVMNKPKQAKKKKYSGKDSTQNASTKLKTKKQKKGGTCDFRVGGSEIFGEKVKKKNEVHEETNIDFSKVPPPVCSCTGVARPCYRCGTSGWQSSCCTRTISEYPLPLSPSKPGVRLSGRKMTAGAYTKLLHRLAIAGSDLSLPVDLKNHWAKHGTNKFVTIK